MMWPQEDQAKLAKWLSEGKKAVEIHRLFAGAHTYNSVVGKIYRYRKYGPVKHDLTASLHGLSVGEMHFFPLTPIQRHSWHQLARYHGKAIVTRRWQERGESGFMVKRIA